MLLAQGHSVRDLGAYSTEPCDNPDFIHPTAQSVARGEYERGIVLGGSGNGEAIVANKVKGPLRPGLDAAGRHLEPLPQRRQRPCAWRTHRDAAEALRIVSVWLATQFEGGRHIARVEKIE